MLLAADGVRSHREGQSRSLLQGFRQDQDRAEGTILLGETSHLKVHPSKIPGTGRFRRSGFRGSTGDCHSVLGLLLTRAVALLGHSSMHDHGLDGPSKQKP